LVVLAAKTALLEGKIPEQELLERKLLIAKELLRKGYSERKVRAIMVFLKNYVLFEDPKMNRIFTKQVRSYDKNNVMNTIEFVRMEAKEEGLAEGRTAGLVAAVKNIIATTEFSDEKIASLIGVTVDFVKEVREGKKR
jgi:hypothetical protein